MCAAVIFTPDLAGQSEGRFALHGLNNILNRLSPSRCIIALLISTYTIVLEDYYSHEHASTVR